MMNIGKPQRPKRFLGSMRDMFHNKMLGLAKRKGLTVRGIDNGSFEITTEAGGVMKCIDRDAMHAWVRDY